MTIEMLTAIRNSAEECQRCGFCANVAPSKKEIIEIIDELIGMKSGAVCNEPHDE